MDDCSRSDLYRRDIDPRQMRVALLVGEAEPPAWIVDCCRRALGLPFVDCVAVIDASGGRPVSIGLDDARSARLVDAGDRDIVGSLKLDVVIDLTPESGPCAVAAASRRGLLRLERNWAATGPRDIFSRFQEVRVDVLLHRPKGGDAIDPDGELVYRNHDAVQLSIHAARRFEQLDRASVLCLARALRLLRRGDLPLAASSRSGDPRFDGEPSGLWQSLRHVGVCVLGNVEARRNRLAWQLAWRRAAADDLPGLPGNGIRDNPFRLVELPDEGEAADPFIVSHEGQPLVFFERVPPGSGRGELACARLDADGHLWEMREVLRRPYHLSYPHVFEVDGQWWMIPETGEASKVDLYRAEQFPDRWVHERTLLEGFVMLDSTLHHHDGRWYLFVTVDESGLERDQALFVFSSTRHIGPFEPHPLNPVRTDIRVTRGAGAIIEQADGTLLRPAQDGSGGYGSRLAFQRITELSADRYAEESVGVFRPEGIAGLCGCHTFNQAGGIQLVDVRRRLPRR
ncbi:MAG: hypothetical protein H6851_18425 [Geminicoccaceae bacterium]|nr:hypothetical protein [Geminicoccaceae bacterium]